MYIPGSGIAGSVFNLWRDLIDFLCLWFQCKKRHCFRNASPSPLVEGHATLAPTPHLVSYVFLYFKGLGTGWLSPRFLAPSLYPPPGKAQPCPLLSAASPAPRTVPDTHWASGPCLLIRFSVLFSFSVGHKWPISTENNRWAGEHREWPFSAGRWHFLRRGHSALAFALAQNLVLWVSLLIPSPAGAGEPHGVVSSPWAGRGKD